MSKREKGVCKRDNLMESYVSAAFFVEPRSCPCLSVAFDNSTIHLPMLELREKDGVVGDQKGNQSGVNPRAKILGQLSYILVVLVMKIGTSALLQRWRLDMYHNNSCGCYS